MTGKKKSDRIVVEPKDKGLAVFSYAGLGFAVNIGDHTIDEVFDVAKKAIKLQLDKEGEQSAVQERKAKKVHVRQTSKDSKKMGKEVRNKTEKE